MSKTKNVLEFIRFIIYIACMAAFIIAVLKEMHFEAIEFLLLAILAKLSMNNE